MCNIVWGNVLQMQLKASTLIQISTTVGTRAEIDSPNLLQTAAASSP